MPNTTRSAFHSAANKGQRIGPTPKQTPPPVPVDDTVSEKTVGEEVVTISKVEYEGLLEAKKKLDDLQNVLNK